MPLGTPGVQLGTGWPGMSQGFEFKNVPVNPGGTITYTADYGAPGNAPLTHYTGTGSFKFAAPAAMRDALRDV